MPYSNISASLSAGDATAINGALDTIFSKLGFLINLTTEERQKIYKMGPNAKSYVDKAKDYAASFPTLVPAFTPASEFNKDYDLYAALAPIFGRVKSLSEAIDDTMMAIGSEEMDFLTALYNSAKEAAKRNVAGAGNVSDDLGEFFDRPDQPEGPVTPPTP